MPTKVGVKIEPGALRKAVKRSVDPVVRRRVEEAGKEMVKVANALMASEYDLNRVYERRRYPGSRRAANALDFSVVGDTDSTLRLRFRVLGGDEVLKRILILNYGARAHRIEPSGAWSLQGVTGSVQNVRTGGGKRSGGEPKLAWVSENGDNAVVDGVDHPGQAGTGFLQEAVAVAAARLGGRIVT